MSQLLFDWFKANGSLVNRLDGTLVQLEDHRWGVFRYCGYDLTTDAAAQGCVCLNPSDMPNNRVYASLFEKTDIFMGHITFDNLGRQTLHGQVELARRVLDWENPRAITIGMSGLSRSRGSLTLERYERHCHFQLDPLFAEVLATFGITLNVSHGASQLGIDNVAADIATKFGLNVLGHSCPLYLVFVRDREGQKVIVAPSVDRYSDTFTGDTHLLLSLVGGVQTLMHDIRAIFLLRRAFIPINIGPFIFSPADLEPKDDSEIIDATDHLLRTFNLPGYTEYTDLYQLRHGSILRAITVIDAILRKRGVDTSEMWTEPRLSAANIVF